MWQSQRLIEDVRRNTIGMGDVAYIHPAADRFILVIMPIDRFSYGADSVEPGEPKDKQEHPGDDPLSPGKCFQRLKYSRSHKNYYAAFVFGGKGIGAQQRNGCERYVVIQVPVLPRNYFAGASLGWPR